MRGIPRRSFLQFGAAAAVLDAPQARAQITSSDRVVLFGDGLGLSPAEYAALIAKIAAQDQFHRDTYLADSAVQELEKRMAALLNKERALFLPTGTLANHLACRLLAGEHRKVLVQEEGHLYRDEGDCAQLLSGLNLVPLAPGRATITADELAKAVEQAGGPPYPAPVGAISIESPVRRTDGQVFDYEQMRKICDFARAQQIGTHLDGARMFLASAYTGIAPAQYAALFDTVYVSLYKYFNAPFGAILSGPAPLIGKVETLRHQFGSTIYQGWESAAVALHFFDGFSERYQAAVKNGEQLIKLLEASGRFRIERVPSGTNIALLQLASGGALDTVRDRLAQSGIMLAGKGAAARVPLMVNESINRRPAEEIAAAFVRAAG
jgi:threonine aldolase